MSFSDFLWAQTFCVSLGTKNVGNQTVAGPFDSHSIFFFPSMATSNYLVVNILQNIFFYV